MKEVEPKVTWYDTIAGDGDCGTTLVSGGRALDDAIQKHTLRLTDAAHGIEDIAYIVEDSMGGTSGGLYSIYLSALAKGISDSGDKTLTVDTFCSGTSYSFAFVQNNKRHGKFYGSNSDNGNSVASV